jgi:hypothetical protein
LLRRRRNANPEQTVIERANIIDETFDHKNNWYFLSVSAAMDDEAGTIEVEIRLAWNKLDNDLAHERPRSSPLQPSG